MFRDESCKVETHLFWGQKVKGKGKGEGRILLSRYLRGDAATSRAVQSQEVAVDW